MTEFEQRLDKNVLSEFNHFLNKVNLRTCIEKGWTEDNYLAEDMDGNPCPALEKDVEYFHPVITMDDRMRYIAENIVTLPDSDISPYNKVCNTIISHFYGARGIHQTLTGISDPRKAHVDFEAIDSGDEEYTKHIQKMANHAKRKGTPLWGTTELHTSIQTAGRNFCRRKYGIEDRKMGPADVAEWVASFISDGTVDKLLEAKNLEEGFKILTSQPGIGEYYGYHCATSNSVNPAIKFDQDDPYVRPGPGARETCEKMFPGLNKKLYGDAIVWIRENQEKLLDVDFHPNMANIEANGKLVFENDQNELKCYGTEVAFCQFSVFLHLKENPSLAKKRKVARVQQDGDCAGNFMMTLF